jgi:hypothetical protein
MQLVRRRRPAIEQLTIGEIEADEVPFFLMGLVDGISGK